MHSGLHSVLCNHSQSRLFERVLFLKLLNRCLPLGPAPSTHHQAPWSTFYTTFKLLAFRCARSPTFFCLKGEFLPSSAAPSDSSWQSKWRCAVGIHSIVFSPALSILIWRMRLAWRLSLCVMLVESLFLSAKSVSSGACSRGDFRY